MPMIPTFLLELCLGLCFFLETANDFISTWLFSLYCENQRWADLVQGLHSEILKGHNRLIVQDTRMPFF